MHADADILARAIFGADAGMDFEHCLAGGQFGNAAVELIGAGHRRERLHRHPDQRRMRDPGAVMAVAHLTLLVGTDLGKCGVVSGGIVLDRDLRRHPAHRVGSAAVAGVDQAQRVSRQERLIHGHRRAVGGEPIVAPADALDGREDIIPAAAVEPDDMGPQRMEYLVHLEGGVDRLDQHGDAGRAVGQADLLLGESDDVAPQRRFLGRFQLGEIKICARPGGECGGGIVQQIEREIDECARQRLAVHGQVTLVEVEAARADDEDGGIDDEGVILGRGRIGEGQRATPAIDQIGLAVEDVVPRRRGRILEIGHEGLGARIECVDDHLASGRAGDFDAAVLEVARGARDRPIASADRCGIGPEVGQIAGIVSVLLVDPRGEQSAAARIEPAVDRAEQCKCGRGQDFPGTRVVARCGFNRPLGKRGFDHARASCVMT